jgi:serine/threonine protein kinase/formylglycine-generating enzyme required for sulfatase activity
MNPEHWQEVETFRKCFREELRRNELRSREDYLREFPELEREIDSEFDHLHHLQGATVAGPNEDSDTATMVTTQGATPQKDSGHTGRIGRYILERELGRGGQGQVYLARDAELGREVALKVLAHGHALSPMARLRFKGEAEKAAKLDHPNVARIYEWGEEDDVPFIAMEYVRGETLAARIRNFSRVGRKSDAIDDAHVDFDDDTATIVSETRTDLGSSTTDVDRDAILKIVKLIESAARGLHEAHERGLVHRDIKPGNLVVAPDRGLVILDFGLASDIEGEGPELTMTGDLLGTPAYMSPEQLQARRGGVDRRSDVYSLGVTLFECLALRRPFEGASREALFQEILGREAPDLRRLNPRVPVDLAVIVNHTLEKHPDRRYPTALDLAEDLRRFREREPIVARPIGASTRAWRWMQRNPATAGLLATVFLALVTITVLTSLNSRELRGLNSSLEASMQEARRNEKRAREETEAKAAALEAERSARAAEARALAQKTAAIDEYERMADTHRLTIARREAERLWPTSPELVPKLLAWQERHAPLFARLADYRQTLKTLRAEGQPYTEADRARDFATEFARIAHVEAALNVEGATVDPGVRARFKNELRLLRETVSGQRSCDFGEDVVRQFRHDTLTKLEAELRAFIDPKGGVTASITERLDRSRRIERETLTDGAELWDACRQRIATEGRYRGLDLAPQLGLIPLGPDPASGLEEFLDWRTHDWSENNGALPERDEKGRLAMTATRGIVFVLIPGGTFQMGAQKTDPTGPNFDPNASRDESPVHDVSLAPYLLSKYEMTQGQWERLEGTYPSTYGPGAFNAQAIKTPVDRRHPVEGVNWHDSRLIMSRLGLQLPTEAQWERAARADANPPMTWSGTSRLAELPRFANVSGLEAKPFFAMHTPEHRDDFVVHAPAGSFVPNAFGLFDMTGNVCEWCREIFTPYTSPPARGDGFRAARPGEDGGPVTRGGSFHLTVGAARIAARGSFEAVLRDDHIGLRPARALTD